MREIKLRARLRAEIGKQKPLEWFYWTVQDGFTDPDKYVDLETLGEYTGLLDKNGKEIYEGDIIGYMWFEDLNRYYATVPVIFERGCFEVFIESIAAKHNLQLGHIADLETECEVIGNIMENPDLLK